MKNNRKLITRNSITNSFKLIVFLFKSKCKATNEWFNITSGRISLAYLDSDVKPRPCLVLASKMYGYTRSKQYEIDMTNV